jgi:molybdenum cofactor biosynthesis enzyme MoaA
MGGRIVCAEPWENLFVYPTDHYGPCCDLSFHGRPRDLGEAMRLYNSPEMVAVRQALIDGTALGTTCKNCGIAAYANYLPEGEDGYYAGKTAVVSAPPRRMATVMSNVCNLRCIMCDSHSGPLLMQLGRDNVAIMEQIGFDKLEGIVVSGGEPFLSPDALHLLKRLAEVDTKHMRIGVITNALVIDRQLELVKKLRNLHLTISVDGGEEAYHHVRKRARWSTLIKNLAKLKKIADGRSDMVLNINSIVMRSTLPQLSDVIDLAIWLEADLDFQIIRENSCEDEEIRGVIPRDEVLDHLGRAIAYARRHASGMRRNRVSHITRTLNDVTATVKAWWEPFYRNARAAASVHAAL